MKLADENEDITKEMNADLRPQSVSPKMPKSIMKSSSIQNTQNPFDPNNTKLIEQMKQERENNLSQMKLQQEQLETELQVKFQQQVAQQQQMLSTLMAKQQEEYLKNMQTMSTGNAATTNEQSILLSNYDESYIKDLKVTAHKAEINAARLEAELQLIKEQHEKEIELLSNTHNRQLNIEREVWNRTEERLKEERDTLALQYQTKLGNIIEEKQTLVASFETQVIGIKQEWTNAVNQTKEVYTLVIDRMKNEHETAIDRLNNLKEIELKAVVSATEKTKDVEEVLTQLEENTDNLSKLTSSINVSHSSSKEMVERALEMKEKQLKDYEATLSASKAEAESERARLTALIQRLETALIQQGSEVENEKWRIAQERIKIEIERKTFEEEKHHLQIALDSERQNLLRLRDNMSQEQQALLKNVAQYKLEVSKQQNFIETSKLSQNEPRQVCKLISYLFSFHILRKCFTLPNFISLKFYISTVLIISYFNIDTLNSMQRM